MEKTSQNLIRPISVTLRALINQLSKLQANDTLLHSDSPFRFVYYSRQQMGCCIERSKHTFLRIVVNELYEYTKCRSYRQLLSIPLGGTNARSVVNCSLKNRQTRVESNKLAKELTASNRVVGASRLGQILIQPNARPIRLKSASRLMGAKVLCWWVLY